MGRPSWFLVSVGDNKAPCTGLALEKPALGHETGMVITCAACSTVRTVKNWNMVDAAMLCTYLCAPCSSCAKVYQGMVCLTAGSPLTLLATGTSDSGKTYA
jgi:hypothetical protein